MKWRIPRQMWGKCHWIVMKWRRLRLHRWTPFTVSVPAKTIRANVKFLEKIHKINSSRIPKKIPTGPERWIPLHSVRFPSIPACGCLRMDAVFSTFHYKNLLQQQQLIQPATGYNRSSWILDYFGIFWDSFRIFGIILGFWGIFRECYVIFTELCWDFWDYFAIFWDFLGFFEIFTWFLRNYVGIFWDFFGIFAGFFGIFRDWWLSDCNWFFNLNNEDASRW